MNSSDEQRAKKDAVTIAKAEEDRDEARRLLGEEQSYLAAAEVRIKNLETEQAADCQKFLDAIKGRCQCRFKDGVRVEECHYHACERFVRMENGDPSDETWEQRALAAEARESRLREAAQAALTARRQRIEAHGNVIAQRNETAEQKGAAFAESMAMRNLEAALASPPAPQVVRGPAEPESDTRGPAVLVTGGVIGGFEFYGPFPTIDDAAAWYEKSLFGFAKAAVSIALLRDHAAGPMLPDQPPRTRQGE
jgi:hypothetical protein